MMLKNRTHYSSLKESSQEVNMTFILGNLFLIKWYIVKFVKIGLKEILKNKKSTNIICLNINTKIALSSHLSYNREVSGQDRIIEINRKERSSHYINAIGGQELYSKEIFKDNNIELNFLDTELTEYNQFKNEFIPYLSIIDILMFNSKNEIKEMLKRYELVWKR